MKNIDCINNRLLNNFIEQDFAGYDNFDGLNSPILHKLGLYRFQLVRLAWIQLFNRSPINFPFLACIPKKCNCKGVAIIILGLLEDYARTQQQKFLDQVTELDNWLLDNRCDSEKWKRSCWGYHFPWEARAFHVPVGKPNIITTCYVARSLWALSLYQTESKFEETANDAGRFIFEELYPEDNDRCFFAYVPGELAFVHNVSLWGATIVAETSRRLSDQNMAKIAHKVCMQSIKEQQPVEHGSMAVEVTMDLLMTFIRVIILKRLIWLNIHYWLVTLTVL